MGDSTWPLSTMARTVLSLALLACLGLAILHLVSAQEQNKEQEDKTPNNVVIQIKPEEQKMRLLREADPSKNESSKKCKSGKRDQNGKLSKKRGKAEAKMNAAMAKIKTASALRKEAEMNASMARRKTASAKKEKTEAEINANMAKIKTESAKKEKGKEKKKKKKKKKKK